MNKLKLSFLFLFIIVGLIACTTPPETVEPDAEGFSGELEKGEPVVVDGPEQDTALSTPAAEQPQDYPSPEPIVVQPESYPEPEAVVVAPDSYPEPEAEAAEGAVEAMPERESGVGPYLQEIVIPMADELPIVGTLKGDNSNGPQPGILLLHMLGGTRNDWETTGFADVLNQNGYATLAIDMRGHGESISSVDWALAEQDLIAVWDWFMSQPGINPDTSGIVGSSIGSNLALRTAANQSSVQASVLLSPGLNYRDVTTDDVMPNMDRPVLIVTMADDTYAAESSEALQGLNPDISQLVIEPGNAHGTRMFGAYAGLEAVIIEFLDANLK